MGPEGLNGSDQGNCGAGDTGDPLVTALAHPSPTPTCPSLPCSELTAFPWLTGIIPAPLPHSLSSSVCTMGCAGVCTVGVLLCGDLSSRLHLCFPHFPPKTDSHLFIFGFLRQVFFV